MHAVMSIGFVILFPVTFMSNIFVDPRTMPGWLRDISDINPVSHLVTATRALMGGTPIARSLGYTSEYAFNRAFTRHRRTPPGRYRAQARLAQVP